MATITPSWTENQSGIASSSLTACVTKSFQIDVASLGFDLVTIQVGIDIGSAAGSTISFYASPDSGTTFDSRALVSYRVSTDDTRTIQLFGVPFVETRIVNNDGANDLVCSAIYAGRQWSSA
jgi:hypothetical protein